MRKKIYIVLFGLSVLFFSCSKDIEDSLVGKWQLTDSWKQQFLGRDYFTTGYENGFFTFLENGNASYIDGTDTLTGFWFTRQYRYDGVAGDGSDTRQAKYLKVDLANFQTNKRLVWEFDDFRFKDRRSEIRAEQFTLGGNRVYDFEKR